MTINYSDAESAILYTFIKAHKGDFIPWNALYNMRSVGVILTPEQMEFASETLMRQGIFRRGLDAMILTEMGERLIKGLRYDNYNILGKRIDSPGLLKLI